jgi:O-antigen ligase
MRAPRLGGSRELTSRLRAALPSKRSQAARERLAFTTGRPSVPGQALVDAALANDARPTFATAAYAEPRDWGYLGLMAFTAVLLLRPQDTIPALEPLHLAELFALVGIAPMLVHRFARRLPVFRITPETVALMVLGGVMLGTAPFSIWPGGALDVFINAYLKIVVVFVLMMNTLTTPRRIERLVWLIVLCCGYIAGRAVIDYVRGVNLVENDRLAGPVGGIFGNPNDLALNMVTFMPAAMLIAMSRRFGTARRVISSAIVLLMVAVVVFTKSRGGSLGLIATVAALVLLGRKVRPGFAMITVTVILASLPLMPQSFWARMSSIVNEDEDKQYTGSREARRIVMQEGIDAFLEHPLTGVGAGQFKNYNPTGRQERWREAHNVLIQVAADMGLFGLLAFSFLIARAVGVAVWTRRILGRRGRGRDPDPLDVAMTSEDRQTLYVQMVAMTAGLIGWLTCALFASVAYSWTFYYPLAIIVATHELTRDRLRAARAIAEPDAHVATLRAAGHLSRHPAVAH